MTAAAVRECRWCRRRQTVRLGTDGRGQVIEEPLPCRCEERRAAGECIDCGWPVQGKSLRCGLHKARARARHGRRYRDDHPERVARIQREQNAKRRGLRGTKEGADAVRARDRAYRRANRDRINENRRRRDVRDRGAKKAEWARRYKERHPERVKAQQDAANARRAAEKRAYMHTYATKYVGEGKVPRCRRCSSPVPFSGRGRPRLDCFTCRPLTSRERRQAHLRSADQPFPAHTSARPC